MDILYIHPAKQEVNARYDKYKSCAPYPFIPVGVVGLMNRLRARWDVQGINLPMELIMRPGFDLKAWLAAHTPANLVLIDLHWYEHAFGALDVARAVKQIWPHVPVALGGLTASNFAEEILTDFAAIDYIIRGDAEEPLRLLADHCCGVDDVVRTDIPNLVWRRHGEILQNSRAYFATGEMLDSLDFVSMDWLRNAKSYAALQYSGAGMIALRQPTLRGHWLTIGRGCVFNCIYCGGGKQSHADLAGRSGYVVRSPACVVDDIARLQERGYHQVSLSLDPATFKPAWWRTFFAQLRAREVRMGLYNEFFQLPSNAFLEAFAGAADLRHTEVAISPLSGNETVRRKNGKFYSNQKFLQMLETLKQFRIPIFIYFSLNLPGETPQTFKETLALADQIGKTYPPDLLRMLNPCHTLDPVSPMSRQPDAFGMEVQYRTFRDYYTYCRGTGWLPRHVIRGQHRGFEMTGRPASIVEQMARIWDIFAQQQRFRCFPVPHGW